MKTKMLLTAALCLLLTACSTPEQPASTSPEQTAQNLVFTGKTVNLSDGITAHSAEVVQPDESLLLAQTEFSLNLLRQTADETKNTLLSPYSVTQALAMTANGAAGQTRSEMETLLGGSMDTLNPALLQFRTNQPDTDSCKLLTANSIWFRDDADRIQVKPDFLQVTADYYGAEAFKAPFNADTVKDINTWVDQHTEHMIPEMLRELSDSSVVCLLNAVTFDAKWGEPYESTSVHDKDFTNSDGSIQTAQMMFSEEYQYLSDEHATGFLKFYRGGRYAFAALLPEEGMTVTEYLQTLSGDSLREMLKNPENCTVYARMPKFSYDYDVELTGTLPEMGMPTAFTPDADFSAMADTATGELYIGKVLHKTHIDVDTEGTRAAAATAVMMNDDAAMLEEEPKEVLLDRPFLYCIVDTDTSLPVFIGTVENLNS